MVLNAQSSAPKVMSGGPTKLTEARGIRNYRRISKRSSRMVRNYRRFRKLLESDKKLEPEDQQEKLEDNKKLQKDQ